MKLNLVLLCLLAPLLSFAQIDYFISIDAEGDQPFSVLVNNKLQSSTPNGHLVLSGLKDSFYIVNVNFPQNQYPEQVFKFIMGRRDRGYDLKKSDDNSWILIDWQRFDTLRTLAKEKLSLPVEPMPKRNDPLANLLAGSLNDSSILVSAKPQEPLPDVKNIPKSIIINEPVKEHSAKVHLPKVELLVDKLVSGGRQLVFAIMNGELMEEAVVLLIPSDSISPLNPRVEKEKKPRDSSLTSDSRLSQVLSDSLQKDSSSLGSKKILADSTIQKDSHIMDSLSFIPINPSNSSKVFNNKLQDSVPEEYHTNVEDTLINSKIQFRADSLSLQVKTSGILDSIPKTNSSLNVSDSGSMKKDKPAPPFIINSDCQEFATDTDVDKLRVKILDLKSLENKLATSKKVFKSKCFTARQIRALSELFPIESEKFNFLELAYPFVSDTPNFRLLKDLFVQPEILAKFRQMVRL